MVWQLCKNEKSSFGDANRGTSCKVAWCLGYALKTALSVHHPINKLRCGTYVQWNTLGHKEGEILTSVTTWMDLEGILLSEISQTEKDKHGTCMWNLKIQQTSEYNTKRSRRRDTENEWVVGEWTSGEREVGRGKMEEGSRRYRLLLLLSHFSRVRLCATP